MKSQDDAMAENNKRIMYENMKMQDQTEISRSF